MSLRTRDALAALITFLACALPGAAHADEPTTPAAPDAFAWQRVRLESDDPRATLEQRPALPRVMINGVSSAPPPTKNEQWEVRCTAPCDVQLSPAETYRVSGSGITPSKDIEIFSDGPTVVRARTGSFPLFVTGGLAGALGSVFTVIGVLIVSGAAMKTDNDAAHPDAKEETARTGWILVGTGGAALIGGAILMLTNRTSTQIDRAPKAAAAVDAAGLHF